MNEPPNPRLITAMLGKLSASFHNRMLELPTNTTACAGGRFARSAASNFLISASHLSGAAACPRAKDAVTKATPMIENVFRDILTGSRDSGDGGATNAIDRPSD